MKEKIKELEEIVKELSKLLEQLEKLIWRIISIAAVISYLIHSLR